MVEAWGCARGTGPSFRGGVVGVALDWLAENWTSPLGLRVGRELDQSPGVGERFVVVVGLAPLVAGAASAL